MVPLLLSKCHQWTNFNGTCARQIPGELKLPVPAIFVTSPTLTGTQCVRDKAHEQKTNLIYKDSPTPYFKVLNFYCILQPFFLLINYSKFLLREQDADRIQLFLIDSMVFPILIYSYFPIKNRYSYFESGYSLPDLLTMGNVIPPPQHRNKLGFSFILLVQPSYLLNPRPSTKWKTLHHHHPFCLRTQVLRCLHSSYFESGQLETKVI